MLPSITTLPRVNRRQLLGGSIGAAGLSLLGALPAGAAAATSVPLYQRCSFGAHAEDEPYPNTGPHLGLERIVNAKLPRMSWFQDFGQGWMRAQTHTSAQSMHALCISWSPRAHGRNIPFSQILNGTHDAMLTAFFQKAAAYPRTVTIRPFWEMNCKVATTSVDYQGVRLCQSTNQFQDTWRYLVRLQRRTGGHNIKWYFCANGADVGTHRMEQYWPGSKYVDEMGFDTYNDNFGPWTEFDAKVPPMYNRLAALNPTIPISLGEMGCRESGAPRGQSKATWSEKMFRSRQFPRLVHIDFFNKDARMDWRVQSSAASLAVYRKYLPMARGGLVEKA